MCLLSFPTAANCYNTESFQLLFRYTLHKVIVSKSDSINLLCISRWYFSTFALPF